MNNTLTGLELVCGDPKTDPATFSRFTLPFGYSLVETDSRERANKPYYKILEANNETFFDRRKYFTLETARALFDRAVWAKVENWDNSWTKDKGIPFYLPNGRTVHLKMSEPLIILFECEKVMDRTRKAADPIDCKTIHDDILHTGFLVVDLYFADKQIANPPVLDDLLYINDLFRYFDRPWRDHSTEHYKSCLRSVPVDYGNGSGSTLGELSDLECYFRRWFNLLEQIPIQIRGFFYRLYPKTWSDAANYLLNTEKYSDLGHNARHLVYADSRSYVWSAALLKEGANSLSKTLQTHTWRAHHHGHWVKFLNVDSPDTDPRATHRNIRKFEQEWAMERTYHRWEESGTWYGFSYHSGVFLGPPFRDVPLWRHFSTMYFDQTILLFYLRVVLFRFSHRLSVLVDERRHLYEYAPENWLAQLKELRFDFMCFTILYQFPLLSNQQQSLEMYELARKYFDIDDLFAEVKQEIDNTYEFLKQEESGEFSKKANQLANRANTLVKLGIPIAVAALVTSFFGMNVDDGFNLWQCMMGTDVHCGVNGEAMIMLLFTIICAALAFVFVIGTKSQENE